MESTSQSKGITAVSHQQKQPAAAAKPRRKRSKASKAVVPQQNLESNTTPSHVSTMQMPRAQTAKKNEVHEQHKEKEKLNPRNRPYFPRAAKDHVPTHAPSISFEHSARALGNAVGKQPASFHTTMRNEMDEQHSKRAKLNQRAKPFLPGAAKNTPSQAPPRPQNALLSAAISAEEVARSTALMASLHLSKKTKTGRRRDPRIILPNSAIHTFDIGSLRADCEEEVRIKNNKFLASYNWTKDKAPIIYVPGAPAQWNPPKLPTKIAEDSGKNFIDHNSARSPASSYLPLFAALSVMQPNYSFAPVSLVADRNSLHKLFDIAVGKFSKDDWRIEVELVGDTMFLTRFEEKNTGWSNPGSGYGHEFERRFLKYDMNLRNSLTHHRFIEYELGGMRCVVRFETDGYVELPSAQKGTAIAIKNAATLSNPRSNPQPDLVASMQAISLRNGNTPLPKDSIAVIQRGHLSSDDSILEVKCLKHNPEKGTSKLSEYKVQCWFSQTQHLFMGKHVDGVVGNVNCRDMREIFGSWEDEHQAQLQKMMALIRGIKEVANSTEDGKCCITSERKQRPAKVRVFKSNAKPLKLSDEMKRRFWGEVDPIS